MKNLQDMRRPPESGGSPLETMFDKLAAVIMDELDRRRDALVAVSRYIWENPEVGYEEFKACEALTRTLEENGFEVERSTAGLETAFVAKRRGRSAGPTVALLAEYDSLGEELAHACGHNLFSTAAVGAALGLSAIMDQVDGTIVVVGTPAEEGIVDRAGGKAILVDHGVFNDVDAAMICHAENRTIVERELVAQQGKDVIFRGKSAHAGGSPHLGINALTAGTLMITNINGIRQHFLPRVIVNPIIAEGGYTPNTIPEKCVVKLSLRAETRDALSEVIETVSRCAEAGALVTGCEYEIVDRSYMYENVVPNHALGLVFKEALDRLGIESVQHESANYSWDIGNVGNVVPVLNPYIKIGSADLVGHTEAFNQAANSKEGYEGMMVGAKAMALTTLKFLLSETTRQEVRDEFEETVLKRNQHAK